MVLANAFALTTIVSWVLCSLFVWLLPDLSMIVSEWWMHGMDLSGLGSWNPTLETFLLGGIILTGSMWVTGYIFGWAWERVSKK